MTTTVPMLGLDLTTALSLPGSANVVLLDKEGTERERLTIVHFVSRSRAGVHKFFVRDATGRNRVRSDHSLGLTDTSDLAAYFAPAVTADSSSTFAATC